MIPKGGLLLYPITVRAAAGHCKREPNEVVLIDALMLHPLSASTVLQWLGCFHVTQRCNLGKIRMEGLVPGGNGIQSRMLTFFNRYAPWDYTLRVQGLNFFNIIDLLNNIENFSIRIENRKILKKFNPGFNPRIENFFNNY